MKIGDSLKAHRKASLLRRTNLTMILNMLQLMIRLNTGDMIQLATTAPSLPQLMTANPPAIIPNPIMAPTMEWVVDTGSDFQVAKLTHKAAARSAEKAPSNARCGSDRTSVETIPLRMVLVTCAPMNVAPTQFRIPAMKTAWRMVMALAPTADAMEFATSLAPIFHDM